VPVPVPVPMPCPGTDALPGASEMPGEMPSEMPSGRYDPYKAPRRRYTPPESVRAPSAPPPPAPPPYVPSHAPISNGPSCSTSVAGLYTGVVRSGRNSDPSSLPAEWTISQTDCTVRAKVVCRNSQDEGEYVGNILGLTVHLSGPEGSSCWPHCEGQVMRNGDLDFPIGMGKLVKQRGVSSEPVSERRRRASVNDQNSEAFEKEEEFAAHEAVLDADAVTPASTSEAPAKEGTPSDSGMSLDERQQKIAVALVIAFIVGGLVAGGGFYAGARHARSGSAAPLGDAGGEPGQQPAAEVI